MKLLNKHNLAVANFASDEEKRYTLQAIQITEKETVATNGHYLVRVSLSTDVKGENFPVVAGFTPNGFSSTLLGAKDCLEISKAIPRKTNFPILSYAAISRDEDKLQVAVTDLDTSRVFTPRIPEGQYPNWDMVMPKTEPSVTIYLNASYLAKLAKAAADFSDNRQDVMRLQVWDKTRAIRMDAVNNETAQAWTAILMPVGTADIVNGNSYPDAPTKTEDKVEEEEL